VKVNSEFYQVVATARDWSLILLVLEGMLLCAVPLYVLLQITKGLRRFLPKVRPALRSVHAKIASVSMGIERVLAALRAPFLWIEDATARVRGFNGGSKGD
jgi:hypothetical protein